MLVLTLNTLLYGQPVMIPEEQLHEGTLEIKRCKCYINMCKEAARIRWKKQDLESLPGKHNKMHDTKKMKIIVRDVVLIKVEDKNKEKWSIRIVE